MKIGLIIDLNKNIKHYQEQISSTIEYFNHEVVLINKHEKLLDNCDELIKALHDKTIDRGIIIDKWGVLPFMYVSKHPGIVCAEINDEHSARMTAEHNNSNIIAFGQKITTIYQMRRMIASFLKAQFYGERHMVRIDMMEKMLSKEKNK